jgi:outer membrane protein assembly factor BamB
MLRFGFPPLISLLITLSSIAADWPQFRGPDGQGRSDARNLPAEWSDDSPNIVWKSAIGGLGWSSPTVQGNELWVTTADENGRSLRAICLDVRNGRPLRDVEVFRQEAPGAVHTKNSHASPTPVLSGDRVFVHYGAFGTACLSREGKVLWRRKLEYNHVHGPGGSPLLLGKLLIINCDGADQAFVAALDVNRGEVRWRIDRPENPNKRFAFSTPLPIGVGGQTQVVSAGAGGVAAYDPQSGREIWRVDYPGGYSVVPRPVFAHGLVFVSSGYDDPVLYAIRADGNGNVTDTHVAWTTERNAPRNASPLVVGDEVYIVSDGGVAVCLDARSGEVHWQERLGGNFSASPVYGDGKIYFQDENGQTTVIAPGKEYRKLAVNSLPGRTLATPALLDGAVLLRTDTHLYRIGS